MNTSPIKSDSRYTVASEFCGYDSPRWVARFCGEWIGQSISRSAMVLRCASDKAIRNGAAIIAEQSSASEISAKRAERTTKEWVPVADFYAFTAIACVYLAVFTVIVYALDRWNASLDNDCPCPSAHSACKSECSPTSFKE